MCVVLRKAFYVFPATGRLENKYAHVQHSEVTWQMPGGTKSYLAHMYISFDVRHESREDNNNLIGICIT